MGDNATLGTQHLIKEIYNILMKEIRPEMNTYLQSVSACKDYTNLPN